MKKAESTVVKESITVFCRTVSEDKKGRVEENPGGYRVHYLGNVLCQKDFIELLNGVGSGVVVLADEERISMGTVNELISAYRKETKKEGIYYWTPQTARPFLDVFDRVWGNVSRAVVNAPFFAGDRDAFYEACADGEVSENPLKAVGYSLQRSPVKLNPLTISSTGKDVKVPANGGVKRLNYFFKLPLLYLLSGRFFREFSGKEHKAEREMVYRMLMLFLAVFFYIYMPYLSRDYGISGDEFIDDRQSTYVLNYFEKGDKTALDQPQTLLHLYGSSIQVMIKAASDFLGLEDAYAFRHFACSLVGAWGIWIVGLLGLRFGGGLCGLLSMLLMFFTPRYLGHSMNNLKDVPFAVGYVMSVYYFIRLFDYYPRVRLSHVGGAVTGIFLALGTRSGGLMLYPMLLMYGGLFYLLRVGVKEFYKFSRYGQEIGRILLVIAVVLAGGYICSILLWPFALQSPLKNVLFSLEQFTNINTGLRTIFEGKQMMSNMLPPTYAPKYLTIGVPVVTVLGFFGYILYAAVRRKEFSLVAYFLLFAAIFPVFWVVYKKSNLYGGIRHLLFVMPLMVVVAAQFWTLLMSCSRKYVAWASVAVWLGLFSLPVIHTLRNHPNEYVYFNEFAGGLKGTYGDYETDYYFNSLKDCCDWFKKNVELPKDRKTYVVTQHLSAVQQYFRKDTNVVVIYSRYYEKYSKDWDYAIFGNVYINRFQLLNGLFPIEGTLYTSTVDGFPMSFVAKRVTKDELAGFQLEKQGKIDEALQMFEDYAGRYKGSEEVYARMAKLYYMRENPVKADSCVKKALELHPSLNESLYISVLVHIQRKDYPGALEAVQSMLAENASSVDAYYLRALVYFHQKKYKEAIDDVNNVMKFREDERALMLAGDIMRISGNYKQAADIYQRLLSIRKDMQVMTLLAETYCRMKDFQKADALLQEINRANPGFFPAYKVLARMFLMQNNLPEAAKVLNQLNHINNDAGLFVLRGMYFKGVNNPAAARQMFEEALKLDPEDPEALQFMK